MATDIDSLQIEINAKASKANDALDRLIGKLDRLTTSLASVDGSKLYGLANGVERLGSAMQTMNGVKTSDFTRLANNLTKLNSVDTANFRALSLNIHSLVSSLKGLSGASDSAKQIIELANAIKQLGYKSAEKAIANIPQLAIAVKQLMAELSKAPKVSRNLIDLVNALVKLARTGASSGRAATSLSNALNTYSSSARNARTHTFSLASAIGKIYATYWMLFRIAGKVKDAINLSSDLTEVQNVVDVTFGKYTSLVEDMAKTSITDFGMSELTVKQVASRFQAMGTAMGFTQGKMTDMSIELTKLTADMASFYNVEQKDVAQDLESVFTGQTRPLRTYGLDLTEATLKEWALKQGLDANIDSMSQAEKTMLRYQYVMANTGAAQGDFVKTADTWANQTRILKQNIEALGAVMGGTFINMLKPVVKALNVVISKLREFATAVSNSLGKIFGWQYESSDVGISSDFEDAEEATGGITDNLGSAGEKAKKLKQILLGIDELNVVDQSDSTSSGNGSAGTATGGASSGDQWTKTDGILKEYESELDSLYKLGSFISEKLTNALNSIDWDSIYESARNFGTGLAQFLNGLITPSLFDSVGKTIASALNTAIYAALSFGEAFDFYKFGVSIATGINSFFVNFDFGTLAESLNTWVDGLKEAIQGFLRTLSWKDIIGGISDFLGTLELDTVAVMIGAFTVKNSLKDIGKTLASSIGKKIGLIEIASLLDVVDKLKNVLSPVNILIGVLAAGLGITYAKNEEVRESFGNAIQELKEGLEPVLVFFTDTVLPGLKNGWEEVRKTIQPLTDFLSGTFVSIWQDMINPALTYVAEEILPLVTEKIKLLWHGVLVPLGTFLMSVLNPVIQIVSSILTTLWQEIIVPLAQAIGKILGEALQSMCSTFNKVVVPVINVVISVFDFLWNKVLMPIIDYLRKTFKPVFETVFEAIGGIIDGLGDTFSGLIEFITGVFTGDWEKAWEGVKDIFRGVFNGVISIAEGAINGIILGLNNFLGKFDGIVEGFGELINVEVHIPKIPQVELPRFQTGGFVEDGLFMANHNEIVGKFANGKTAVANNEQITVGISQGVRDAVSDVLVPYLSDIARSTRETANKDFTTNIDGRSLVSEINRRSTRNGFSFT